MWRRILRLSPNMKIEYLPVSKDTSSLITNSSMEAGYSTVVKKAIGPVRYSKIVHTGDTQMLHMVQGGLILELLEAAADVAAVKHTNRFSLHDKIQYPALVGIERVEMRSTARVGDLMEFVAEVVDVRPHSIRCAVSVYQRSYQFKDNPILMVRSKMWYVPLEGENKVGAYSNDQQVLRVDGMGRQPRLMQSYLDRIAKRKNIGHLDKLERLKDHLLSAASSHSKLPLSTSYIIKPSNCGTHGFCKSGPLLRWIDEFAGCLAVAYVGIPCVTGTIDNFTFTKSVPEGSCITFVGRPVFSSRRTIDLQIIGCIDSSDGMHQQIFAEAFLTFVAFNLDDQDFSIPPIEASNIDKELFAERKLIYESRKAASKKEKENT